MTRHRKTEESVTAKEVVLMVHLVAKLDPGKYRHDSAKSVIHKCKSLVAEQPDTVWIRP